MSVSLTRSDGVTVLTLTSDPSSTCPPLCQLLGSLCYTPALCSPSRLLTLPRRGSQAVLGSLWIMSGLMHASLGAILLATYGAASYQLMDTYFPVWLGVIFVGVGLNSILTEKYPRPCVLLLSVILNLFGAAMSITAIVWYSTHFYSMCNDDYYYWRPTPSPSPENVALKERCLEVRGIARALVYGVSGVLLSLSVLGLCVGVSSAVLSCKALRPARDKAGSKALLEKPRYCNK
uniref:Uncharacterized protein n=1 Tax=Periophthalmus magnuspinnatus TaxID=409849 RepID=A0A3B4AZ41_9GOBI